MIPTSLEYTILHAKQRREPMSIFKNVSICALFICMMLLSACEGTKSVDRSTFTHPLAMEGKDHHTIPDQSFKSLKMATQSKFKPDENVTLLASHLPGMKNTLATVKAVFHTYVYAVTYQPTNGTALVSNHKWVIHEEIKNAKTTNFEEGNHVILQADHMPGMRGAKATIVTAQLTNVYMVDYRDTITGKMVLNHKWVIESELYK
jgi:Protein of unknown function (DUF1541)